VHGTDRRYVVHMRGLVGLDIRITLLV